MKKVISLIFSLLLVASIIPANAFTSIERYEKNAKCEMTEEEKAVVEETVKGIIESQNLKTLDRLTQITKIQDWATRNISYDYENKHRTGYDGIMEGLTVCTGYCSIGYEFCRQLEIPCDIVYCIYAENDLAHVTLQVQMEDELWYYWDITSQYATSKSLLMGQNEADKTFSEIRTKSSFSNIQKNEVSRMNYIDKQQFKDDIVIIRVYLMNLFSVIQGG